MTDNFPIRFNSLNRSFLRNYLFIGRNMKKNFNSDGDSFGLKTNQNSTNYLQKCKSRIMNQILKRSSKKNFNLINCNPNFNFNLNIRKNHSPNPDLKNVSISVTKSNTNKSPIFDSKIGRAHV